MAGGAFFQRLVELTRRVSHGDYSQAQELFALTRGEPLEPEVEELAEAFGLMLVQIEAREFRLEGLIEELRTANQRLEATLTKVKLLENIKLHLTKFVPEAVRCLIETNPEAPDLAKRGRDVSVLFLDVAGYTSLSERVDQAEMNFLIETYFSAFLDDIHAHRGDVNETAGDGLMIIFQDDDPVAHALNAVATAVAIQARAGAINAANAGRHEPIVINVGINSGLCAVGSTRFEGVSGTRWTFTASGPPTNLAARLGAQAQGGQVLIGPTTAERVNGRFPLTRLGRRKLKNVEEEVEVWAVS